LRDYLVEGYAVDQNKRERIDSYIGINPFSSIINNIKNGIALFMI